MFRSTRLKRLTPKFPKGVCCSGTGQLATAFAIPVTEILT